jgi:murein L,D-transpeptidase YcbB/YkuD
VPATPENIEALERGTLRLRQLPGPNNALGLAKFMMPNSYSVYLHGTPAQSLFARSTRAFSHGCVRVASDRLGRLRADPAWTRDRIVAMSGEARCRSTCATRFVFVLRNAVATEFGNVLFFEDIYGHDAQLERLMHASRLRQRDS